MDANMLKVNLSKWNSKADENINSSTTRAEESEAALKRVTMENIKLEAIREIQMVEIEKMGATLKVAEEKVKAATLKAMEEF